MIRVSYFIRIIITSADSKWTKYLIHVLDFDLIMQMPTTPNTDLICLIFLEYSSIIPNRVFTVLGLNQVKYFNLWVKLDTSL